MADILLWFLAGLTIVAGCLGAIWLIGTFLPADHEVTRSIVLQQSPEVVWGVITDYAKVPSWHPNVVKVERQPDRNGHEVWREAYKGNYGLFLETTEATPPTRLVRTIADDNGPFTGRWEFAITPTETGCTLAITEFGSVRNPFFRFMFRLFMKPETYLMMYLQAMLHKFVVAA